MTERDVEYKQSYLYGSVGDAGDYSVNVRTGKVTLVKELFSLGGNKQPLSMSLVYRQDKSNALDSRTGFPYGWKLNYEQYVYAEGNSYFYVDESDCRHTFCFLAENNEFTLYYDEEQTGLLLYCYKSDNRVEITDDRTVKLTFSASANHRLTEIEETHGESPTVTTIGYNDKNMTITDGMGRVATVTVGAASISIAKPDGKSLSLTVENNRLTKITETDGKVESYSYTQSGGYHLLSTVSSYTGDKIAIGYSGVKVQSINETANNVFREGKTLSYQGNETLISTKKYNSSDAQGKITMVYVHAENGDSLMSYEKVDDNAENVRFRSQEDYERYLLYVNPAESVLGESINKDTVFELTNGTRMRGEFTNVPKEDKEEYVFSAQVIITGGTATESSKVYIELNNTNQSTRVCRLDFNPELNYMQTLVKRFPAGGDFEPAYDFTAGVENLAGATVKFSNIRIGKRPKNREIDCIDWDTGSETSFTEHLANGTKTWYQLTGCAIDGTAGCEKMTRRDWLLTLENYARNPKSYVLWYNDLTNAVMGGETTGFYFGSSYVALSSIHFATVTEDNLRTTFVYRSYGSGDDYVVTTQNANADILSKLCKAHQDSYYRTAKSVDENGTETTYRYDSYGNVLSEKVSSADGVLYTEQTYTAEGKFPATEKDFLLSNTYTQSYAYTENTGNLSSSISPVSLETKYAYAANNVDLTSISATVGSANTNGFVYDAKGRVIKVSHNGFSYGFGYASDNEPSSVSVGGSTLLSMSYDNTANAAGQRTVTVTYANGQTMQKVYDLYGREIYRKSGSVTVLKNVYASASDDVTNVTSPEADGLQKNSNAVLRKRIDNGVTTVYNYNASGKVSSLSRSDGVSISYTYDNLNRVSSETQTINGVTSKTSYAYETGTSSGGDKLIGQTIEVSGKTYTIANGYDKLNRLTSHNVTMTGNWYAKYGYGYASQSKEPDGTTCYLSSFVAKVMGGNNAESTFTDWFSYDGNGNILSISGQGGNNSASYEYDKLNRLTRENNLALNKTYTYTYDAGGNITSKKEYAYTTGALGNVQKTYPYGYRTSGWRDQLLSWNGKSFVYDNAGNPTTYKGESMTWMMGRLLSSYDHSGVVIDYFYAANGERKTKSYGTSTSDFELTNYYYEGGRLLREERTTQDGTKNIYYLYDETGVIGFLYDGYQYYYRKNAQGDILSVHCGTDLHATYTYDAWGNCTISFDAVGIGALNPFRYRGYYLDRETGLYYLMTRYYDPEIGRFVNADDVSYLDPETLNGCNLYAYCLNNPVMGYDPMGTFSFLGLLGVAIVSVIVLLITSGDSAQEDYYKDIVPEGTPSYELSTGTKVYYEASSYDKPDSSLKVYNSYFLTGQERKEFLTWFSKEHSEFNIGRANNEWVWHNMAYGMGVKRESTVSVDLYFNADDVGHGILSWIMNHIKIFANSWM